jgi:hypothetical protein
MYVGGYVCFGNPHGKRRHVGLPLPFGGYVSFPLGRPMSFGRDPSQIRMALRRLRLVTFCVGLRCGPAKTAFGNPHGKRRHVGLPFRGTRDYRSESPPYTPLYKVLRYKRSEIQREETLDPNSLIEKRRNFCENSSASAQSTLLKPGDFGRGPQIRHRGFRGPGR